jgi:hypothetical protein
MTRRWPIGWVVALALVLAADLAWYKPKQAAEAERQRDLQCQRLLRQFEREGRDASFEQRPGSEPEGCRFGAPLG